MVSKISCSNLQARGFANSSISLRGCLPLTRVHVNTLDNQGVCRNSVCSNNCYVVTLHGHQIVDKKL